MVKDNVTYTFKNTVFIPEKDFKGYAVEKFGIEKYLPFENYYKVFARILNSKLYCSVKKVVSVSRNAVVLGVIIYKGELSDINVQVLKNIYSQIDLQQSVRVLCTSLEYEMVEHIRNLKIDVARIMLPNNASVLDLRIST